MTTILENIQANMWMLGIVLAFVSIRLYPLSLRNLSRSWKRYSHLRGTTSKLAVDREYKYVNAWGLLIGNVVLTIISVQLALTYFN